MSWRDIQARVASGGRAVEAPKKDVLGEGVSLLAKSYSQKMVNDSILTRERKLKEEEEAKAERLRIKEERRLADQQEKKAQKNVTSIINSIGKSPTAPLLRQMVYSQLMSRDGDFASTLSYFEDLVKENRLRENPPAASLEGSPVARAAIPETTQEQMAASGMANIENMKNRGQRVGIVASLDRTESSGGKLDAEAPPDSKGRVHGGRLQFGDARLADYNAVHGTNYVATDMKNLSDEEQTKIERWHFSDIDKFIKSEGLDSYIGKEINGTVLTEASLIAVAHLGGKGGLRQYLTTNGRYNEADANGTRLSDYARQHRDAGPLVLPGDPAPDESLDLTQPTFDILPPTATGDQEKPPTSFEQLLVRNLQDNPDFINAPPDEQAKMIQAAKASITGTGSDGKPTTLTRANLAARLAQAEQTLRTADPMSDEYTAAWDYINVGFDLQLASIEAAEKQQTGGADPVMGKAIINGQQVDGQLIGNEFKPFGSDKAYTMQPQDEDGNVPAGNYFTDFVTDESAAQYTKVLSQTKQERKDVRKQIVAAADVAEQGYQLATLVEKYPGALTTTAQGLSLLRGAGTELSTLFETVENFLTNEVEGEDLSQLTASQRRQAEEVMFAALNLGSQNEANTQVYREFTAAMTRFIFAAGKALGQTGNGFSNQDYRNIRNSMMSGNNIVDFMNNIKRFTRERMNAADNQIKGWTNSEDYRNLTSFPMYKLQNAGDKAASSANMEDFLSDTFTVDGTTTLYEWANNVSDAPPQQQQTSEIPPKPTSLEGVPRLTTEEEHNAWPKNVWYVDPTGTLRIKTD